MIKTKRMSARTPLDRDKIAEFCRRWKITEFALVGSVLREDELKEIFGRKVDLVSRRGIETSPNYIRRTASMSSAAVIHVA